MKELIKRLRGRDRIGYGWLKERAEAADALEQQAKRIAELERATDHAIEINNALQSELEQQAKQIEELAAALAGKDEALHSIAHEFLSGHYECQLIAKEALALQPHASIVAKIKADAVRAIADKAGKSGCVHRDFVLQLADHIEREGK